MYLTSTINPIIGAKKSKIVHQDIKAWNFTWKVSVTLGVKNHSDPPSGPYSWIFYRPEWKNGKTFFFLQILILNTVGKLIENLTKNNRRVGSENGLVTSYNRSKILKNLGKISILIPVCSWKYFCCKQSNCIH